MSKNPRVGLWFAATSAIFFTRAFMFSSWVSRGPEAQAALDINTAQMGLLSMLYPAGGLAGILFSSWLVNRFGSKTINTISYVIAAGAFLILGQALDAGNVTLAAACLFAMGLPMAINDYLGNFEATNVDRAAKRSLLPSIHGAFGVGMLAGASVASMMINQSISLSSSFLIVSIFVAALSVMAGFAFPQHVAKVETAATKAKQREQSIKVWFERRSILISIIGFAFIVTEMSAGTWVPIALTKVGFDAAAAAGAFGVFWIVITIARLSGGFIVDTVGRFQTILLSTVISAIGVVMFINIETLNQPYLALIVWGFGMALGFPSSVMTMGDDAAMAPPRVNMIISVVYIASVTVGPALGSVGQVFGIFIAFSIPVVLLVIAAILSPVTKPLTKPVASK